MVWDVRYRIVSHRTLLCVQVVSVVEASPVSLVFQDHKVPLVQLVRLVMKFR